jgi:hypothetical protein
MGPAAGVAPGPTCLWKRMNLSLCRGRAGNRTIGGGNRTGGGAALAKLVVMIGDNDDDDDNMTTEPFPLPLTAIATAATLNVLAPPSRSGRERDFHHSGTATKKKGRPNGPDDSGNPWCCQEGGGSGRRRSRRRRRRRMRRRARLRRGWPVYPTAVRRPVALALALAVLDVDHGNVRSTDYRQYIVPRLAKQSHGVKSERRMRRGQEARAERSTRRALPCRLRRVGPITARSQEPGTASFLASSSLRTGPGRRTKDGHPTGRREGPVMGRAAMAGWMDGEGGGGLCCTRCTLHAVWFPSRAPRPLGAREPLPPARPVRR